MDARPALVGIAKALEQCGLEAVLIGNAAAALHGAPVTTVDFDFMFRKTPGNLRKLKALAAALDAVILKQYYPPADLFRIVRDEDGLQVDFMASVHGVRSIASLKSRARTVGIGDATLLVAGLADVVKNKKAAGRPRDFTRKDKLEALKKASELALRDQIHRLLALPPGRR